MAVSCAANLGSTPAANNLEWSEETSRYKVICKFISA